MAARDGEFDVADVLTADLERREDDGDLISESDVSVATENFRSDDPFKIALKLMSVIQEHHQNRTALAIDRASAELIITLDANGDRERDARLLRILQALWPALSLDADKITIEFADLVDTQVLLFKNTYLDGRLYAQPTAVPVAISGESLPPAPSSPTALSIAPTPTPADSGHPFRSLPLEFSEIQVALQAQLVTACERGDLGKVRELIITHHADLSIANKEGKLPLGAAIWSGNIELVTELDRRLGGLSSQAWQICAETNMQAYGRLVPEVPDFNECSRTYKDLARWYTDADTQHIYGLTRSFWIKKKILPEEETRWQYQSSPNNDQDLKEFITMLEKHEKKVARTQKQRDQDIACGKKIEQIPKNPEPFFQVRNFRTRKKLQNSWKQKEEAVKAKMSTWRRLHNQFQQCTQAMATYVNMKITDTAVAQADNGQGAPHGRDAFYQPATPEAQPTTTTATTQVTPTP